MSGDSGVAAKRRDLDGRVERLAGQGISRQENSE
jgi:hypothetical protein